MTNNSIVIILSVRIAPIVGPVDEAADEEEDAEDNDVDFLRPPHGHTGGKWRPGSRPSIMQGLGFHRDTQRDSSPERLGQQFPNKQ